MAKHHDGFMYDCDQTKTLGFSPLRTPTTRWHTARGETERVTWFASSFSRVALWAQRRLSTSLPGTASSTT